MTPRVGSIIADRYRILEPIGSGGAGNVYRAVHIQLNRDVALKLVRTDVEPEVRKELGARFRREASLAAKLSHPNLVTIYDFGLTEDGLQYVVMALLKGRCLKGVMKTGPMDSDEVARLGAALARGLRHAHSHDLVHRDVKPTNVLLVDDDDGIEQPQLLDFGLVKSTDADLEMTGKTSYLGTPLYMSPEQVRRGGEVDHRTDIYALGCMMYGMVTGVMPYRGDGPLATAMKHIEEPYPEMSKKVPDVPVSQGLEAIIRRCMEKTASRRFQDAGELAAALEMWRETTTGVVRPPSRRWVVPFVGGAGLLGTLGLVVGILGVISLVISLLTMWNTPEVQPPPIVLRGAPVVEIVADKPPLEAPVQEAVVKTNGDGTADPVVQAKPKPKPKPKPKAKPKPKPKPVSVDEVDFSPAIAKKALAWVNTASWRELNQAGVYPKGCSVIVENRPYASLKELGSLRGIGTKTMEAIERAQYDRDTPTSNP